MQNPLFFGGETEKNNVHIFEKNEMICPEIF